MSIDKKLSFDIYVKILCKKAGKNSVFFRSNVTTDEISYKGAYIKYVGKGGGGGGFYRFFKNIFVAQKTIDLNILWPSNVFRKYFMARPINFSFLFKAYL